MPSLLFSKYVVRLNFHVTSFYNSMSTSNRLVIRIKNMIGSLQELRNGSLNLYIVQGMDVKTIKIIQLLVDRTSKVACLRMAEGRCTNFKLERIGRKII